MKSYNMSPHFARLIVWDQVRSSKGDELYVMITSHQVVFMRGLDPHKDSIIFQLAHRQYSTATHSETGTVVSP